jgi:hypothetical protein
MAAIVPVGPQVSGGAADFFARPYNQANMIAAISYMYEFHD